MCLGTLALKMTSTPLPLVSKKVLLWKSAAALVGIFGAIKQSETAPILRNTGRNLSNSLNFVLREFEKLYFKMRYEELDVIERITGCGKPCNYLEYKFHGGKHPSSFPGDHIFFSFYALTRYTWIWREEVFYPSSTMVAEVGGILSLFIGVSFMTIWDGAILVKK